MAVSAVAVAVASVVKEEAVTLATVAAVVAGNPAKAEPDTSGKATSLATASAVRVA